MSMKRKPTLRRTASARYKMLAVSIPIEFVTMIRARADAEYGGNVSAVTTEALRRYLGVSQQQPAKN